MLYRNCAGGVVFFKDQVLLLKNDKGEWVLPKGYVVKAARLWQLPVCFAKPAFRPV